MRGVDWFRDKCCVVPHFCRTTDESLRYVSQVETRLNLQLLLRHQGLADRRMALWRTVLEFAVFTAKHEPHTAQLQQSS
jgi:hypothetical protein